MNAWLTVWKKAGAGVAARWASFWRSARPAKSLDLGIRSRVARVNTPKIFPQKTLTAGVALFCLTSLGAAQAPASQPPSPVMQPAQIIDFLSHTITWYRQLAAEQQLDTNPGDVTFLHENRRVADQVVQLAFDYA